MHHETSRFVYHQKGVVFVNDVERNIFGYDFMLVARAIHHYGDYVVGLYAVVRFDGSPVGKDATSLCSLLYAVA